MCGVREGYGHLLASTSGQVKGWVMQGLGEQDAGHSYYLALFMDALRALDAAAEQPETDPGQIVAIGAEPGRRAFAWRHGAGGHEAAAS